MSGKNGKQIGTGSQASRGWIAAIGLIALVALLSWIAFSAAHRSGETLFAAKGTSKNPPTAPLTLRLLHTNDTWGYTRPCG